MSAQWPAQQRNFAAALLDPRLKPPDFLQARAGASLQDRFDIYRNNVHASLIDALRAGFPVTTRLVGEEFFHELARGFLRQHLPHGAALHDYGAALPGFIRDYTPAASLPYLADVAALDHAWWQAHGAADALAMQVAHLAALPVEELAASRARLHPAMRLIESPHPVHGIWMAHQVEGAPVPPARWEAECVLVTRPQAGVQVKCIALAQHIFLAALARDATLAGATELGLATDPAFDPGTTLLQAIEAGAIQELHP
jgi:hypothetical protein